jgi:EAL domain-containing protein (putative c-di-GMP-specific phosphodiesterase class I)
MSARSIGYPKWTRLLDQSLRQDPSIAERLILEITEGSAMTVPELVNAFMSALRPRGVAFALDDFGAGATSFRYLRDFRFDMVKIDQQFCRDVHKNLDDQALVRAMLLIAQQFEMMTIAEGVENPDAATWLSNSGLHCLQGYFFAMPQLKPSWTLQAPSGATA